jgi:hypothetical protein
VAIHQPLSDVVDAALRAALPTPKIRVRTREGRVISNVAEPEGSVAAGIRGAEPARRPRTIFPYGVSRTYLEQGIRELDLPARVLGNPDGADIVLTLKSYYRRRPESLRQAETGGIPIHILKSNTLTQVKEVLARVYGPQGADAATSLALEEAREAIRRVKTTLTPHEVAPQNAYVRRLQHQLVTDSELFARSTGKEPRRRLRIYPSADMMD